MTRSPVCLSCVLAAVAALGCAPQASESDGATVHRGMCDASAAVEVAPGLVLVANDEDNVLRAYAVERDGPPLYESPTLSGAVDVESESGSAREIDLEGAAWLGERLFLIGSHGRTGRHGRFRAARHRLFAVGVDGATDGATPLAVSPNEGYYDTLIDDLARHLADDPAFGWLDLTEASTRKPNAPRGLNVEGLAGNREGTALLIGFRNPLSPDGLALVAVLENPDAVLERKPARFGKLILLDLGGRGIRSFDWVEPLDAYYLLAGPATDRGDFAVYRWSGDAAEAPTLVERLERGAPPWTPEALYYDSRGSRLRLLSDDGGLEVRAPSGTAACKALSNRPELQSFRARALDLP